MAELKLEILWEDGDILAVNKPPLVVVNRAESIKSETIQDWAEAKLRIKESRWLGNEKDVKTFLRRSGIAHRLDKETSGCLLIGKNPPALISLLSQFKERRLKKEYLALVHGRMTPGEGTVRLPLARSRFDREKWEVRYDGRMAETTWKVERYYRATSLVRLFPRTGRTHQIRVHLAHLGYPIFADEKYLNKNLIEIDRGKLARHFLHAEVVTFKTPRGETVRVTAALTADLTRLLDELGENSVYWP